MSEKNLSPAHVNVEAFLAAKDAGREAFRDDKDWHDITTAMLEAYARSSTALPAQSDTVNSVEELDALPVGTIIEDSEPCVLRLSPDSELWFVPGSTQGWVSEVIELPATVLYRPVK